MNKKHFLQGAQSVCDSSSRNMISKQILLAFTVLGAWQSYSRANVFIHVADKDEFPESSGSLRVFVNAVNGWVNFGPIAKTYFQDKDDDANDGMTYVLASGMDGKVYHHGLVQSWK